MKDFMGRDIGLGDVVGLSVTDGNSGSLIRQGVVIMERERHGVPAIMVQYYAPTKRWVGGERKEVPTKKRLWKHRAGELVLIEKGRLSNELV